MTEMTRPTTVALLEYFLYLGSLGFGGPVALVGYMQRDLGERRGWVTREEYLKSLAPLQLAPGPRAEIGRAACRGRGEISVGGGSFKKKIPGMWIVATPR